MGKGCGIYNYGMCMGTSDDESAMAGVSNGKSTSRSNLW